MLLTKIFQSTLKPQSRGLFLKQAFNAATAKPKTCYYKVLNISTDASFDEVKQSYRELAKKFHPDVMTGETIQEVMIEKENKFVIRDRVNSWKFQRRIRCFRILPKDNNMIMIMVIFFLKKGK